MTRSSRPRTQATTVLRLSKQAKPAAGGTPTVQLRPVEIEAIVESARIESPRTESPRTVAVAPVEAEASGRVECAIGRTTGRTSRFATGSQPIELPVGGTPTVALQPVELDAIIQGQGHRPGAAPPIAAGEAGRRRTVENVRVAIGSTAMAPVKPPAAVSTGNERGPRRPRETLRADKIRPEPPPPPPRKR